MYENWVIDTSMSSDTEFCFVPVILDDHDKITEYEFGFHFISTQRPIGRILAAIHPESQEKAEAFVKKHEERIKCLLQY